MFKQRLKLKPDLSAYKSPARRREARWGLLFISPWLIGFLLFYLMPMIVSLIFSTFDFTLSAPDEATFEGLDIWKRVLFEEADTWDSMKVTFLFGAISLPLSMISSFLLAILLNSKHLIAPGMFRTLFYAPTMVPLIAAILIWNSVLNQQSGWVNRGIEYFTGYEATSVSGGIRWMDNPNLVYFAYSMIGLWGIGNTILINLAGLQNIPTELYEASSIDGANWLRRMRSITIPMMTPIIFYNLVLGMVGLANYFIVPWVLTNGDGEPDGTTFFFMVHFYKQAFRFQDMGTGAALAWLIFIVTMIITILFFASSRFWVYYAGDSR